MFISACSSSDSEELKTIDSGFNVEHVHGLAITKEDSIYMASHDGLLKTKNYGKVWSFAGDDDFDFMGFHALSDGSMITSGHPGKRSDLPNPLGLMESTDNGESWQSKSLLGKVDFHILTSNETKPELLFGIIQMESGEHKAGIYKSIDKGENWERVDSIGLPEDLHDIYSLLSLPNDERILIAGTKKGVLRSEDGGETWKYNDGNRILTALSVVPDSSDILSYSIAESEAGMMLSQDDGLTWKKVGLDLDQDAVAYIAIHPEKIEVIAALTYENNLLISEDGGQNWTVLMKAGKLENY